MPSPKRTQTPEEELSILRRRVSMLRTISEWAIAREIKQEQSDDLRGWDRGYRDAWETVKRMLDQPLHIDGQEVDHV